MQYVVEVDLGEIIQNLPDISPLRVERDFSNSHADDLFLCALGFEDRCTTIPCKIAEKNEYRCHESIYFAYSTNVEDNDINRSELETALNTFSPVVQSIQCDTDDFAPAFRQRLVSLCQKEKHPKVTFDISVCSSKLLLTVFKILFEFNIILRIVYSEANVYHPTKEEAEKKEKPNTDEIGLTKGVDRVFPSIEYPGYNIDALPEAIIAFATFNPDRTKAVITYIDENLLEKPGDRITWIVGIPHHKRDHWRIDYVEKINEIQSQSLRISTFEYKETLKTLHKLHRQHSPNYHLNISPLGSKLQSLGIALFHYLEPDVTIMFAPPVKYLANYYSEGCKATWILDFGLLEEQRRFLDSVGMLKITDTKT